MTTTLPTMSEQAGPDPAAAAFNQRVFADASGSLAVAVAGIGDALGLFRALAGHPGTAADLADRVGVSTRFTAEWLAAMVAHGYVQHRGAFSSCRWHTRRCWRRTPRRCR